MPRHNRRNGERRDSREWGSPRKRSREREREPERKTTPPPRTSPTPGAMIAAGWFQIEEPEAGAGRSPVCGGCLEWFPDQEGGRGTCDHPGSGFLKPWSDTPACPFFHAMKGGR